ncbi:hypothetical protein PIB30_106983 [Stylosanthes scabra]|uniref:Uncharacterized protein n=1 Tax=Stylosanthes scabra TaxID=79078 RepID=A0ABU6SZA3_9FABA|nr:hypothetical protein [Stylosanthes scabra]
MGRKTIYYEIEKHEKYEDSDERVDLDLAVVKMRRFRFESDHLYELPTKSFLALRHRDSSKGKDSSPQRSGSSRRESPMPQYSPLNSVIQLGSPSSPSKIVPPTQGQEGGRLLKSWELLPPFERWMCESDEIED